MPASSCLAAGVLRRGTPRLLLLTVLFLPLTQAYGAELPAAEPGLFAEVQQLVMRLFQPGSPKLLNDGEYLTITSGIRGYGLDEAEQLTPFQQGVLLLHWQLANGAGNAEMARQLEQRLRAHAGLPAPVAQTDLLSEFQGQARRRGRELELECGRWAVALQLQLVGTGAAGAGAVDWQTTALLAGRFADGLGRADSDPFVQALRRIDTLSRRRPLHALDLAKLKQALEELLQAGSN